MALQTKDPSTAVISSVGAALSGGTTSSTKPVITGTADAGNIVVIYDGIRPLGSVVVAANGTWSFTPTADIKAGAHSFAAIAHDTAGNFGASSAVVSVTVASTAVTPATPTITDDHGMAIVAGGTTADAHPQISGTGPAGDIITVYDGATVIGSVKIGSDGKWSFTPATDLSNAAHTITVTDKAPAGTEGPHSGAVSFTVDTSVPAAPTITSATNWNGDTQIGGVPVGAVVASADVVILGKASANAVVYVYDGATLVGSSVAQANGSWNFENRSFAQGSHDITVTVKNAAGTESAHSNHWTFSVNSSVPATPAAPTMTDDSGLPIVAGGTTNDSHPHINGGGATPGDIIKVLDNGVVIGSTTVKPDGTWSFTPSPDLTPGSHDITVIDTNAAGTPSLPSTPTHITIDTSTPATPATPVLTDDSGLLIPAGSTTNDNHPHISGTGTAGDIIKVYDSAILIGSVKIGSDGKWTFTPSTDLSNAAHAINVTETNPAGTASGHSGSIIFTVDSTLPNAPVITAMNDYRMDNGAFITAVPLGGTVTSANVAFGGTATANGVVYVYDGATLITSVKADASGAWFYASKTYTSGLHDMSATQKSPAGVETAHSNHWTFTVNPVIPATPAVPVITNDAGTVIPAGGTTNDTHPHIAGTGTAGDVITVYDNGTVIGSTTVAGNGTWSFTPATDLPSGTNAITVIETNASGNASAVSPPANLVIDSSVPAKPAVPVLTDDSGLLIPAGSSTSDGHPHISGTGKAGDIITVYDGSTVMGSVKIGSDGKWSFMPSSDVSTGAHSISVTDTNAAGTTGPRSDAIAFNFVQVAAGAPLITSVVDTAGSTPGNVPSGGLSHDARPTINGTGVVGDIVHVYANGWEIGSGVVSASGIWSVKANTDVLGHNDITAKQILPSGGSLSAASNTWTIDTTVVPSAPAVPVLTDDSGNVIAAGSTTNDGHPFVSGTGTAGDIITVYDGSTVMGSVKIGSDGKWTFTPSFNVSVGSHSISVTDTNSAGTSPKSGAIAFNYSLVPLAPVITSVVDSVGTITGPIANGGVTDDARPTISGTGVAGDTVYIYQNGVGCGDTKVDATGHWTVRLPNAMSDGLHVMTATQFVSSGSQSPASNSWTITVNTSTPAKPAVPVLTDDSGATIPSGSSTNDGHPNISGTGTAGDIITVYDGANVMGSVKIDSTGHWTFKPSSDVSTGAHSISVTDTNAAGTTGPHSDAASFTFSVAPTETVTISGLYDDTSGSLVLVSPGGSTKDTTPIVKGTVDHALLSGESLVVYRDGTKVGTATMNGTSWSFNDSGVAVGGHTYTARVENSSGSSAYSAGYSFTEASASNPVIANLISSLRLAGNYTATNTAGFAIMVSTAYVANIQSFTMIDNNGRTLTSYFTANPVSWVSGYSGYSFNYTFPVNGIDPGVNNIKIYLTDTSGNKYLAGNFNNVTLYQNTAFNVITWVAPPTYFTGGSAVPLVSAVYGGHDTTADVSDVHALATSDTTDSATTATTEHHAAVSDTQSFVGKTGHDTVDLNADPASYFKESTAHIEGSTVHAIDPTTGTATAVNTLHLTGDHQVLDLTSLTGQTAAAKISGIEVIDLGGQHNTLKLSLVDVLNLGETDLFMKDGKQQMMVNGKEGDEVDLSNSHIAGVADGDWQAHGTAEVGGVTYNVYEHSGAHTELLVQQGVQIVVH